MTIRGGGNPYTAMAAMPLGEWTRRLGALLAEAYDCFMVRTPLWVQPNTSVVCGDCSWPMAGSPRIISHQTNHPITGQFAAVLARVKDKPSAALKKRAVLDPRCARRRWQYAVGAEECLAARVEQKNEQNKAWRKLVCTTLDKVSPIQAVCGNSACTDLGGGRSAMTVPTALRSEPYRF